MAKRLLFTRPASLVGVADRKDVDRDLQRVDKLLEGERIVPESVFRTANAVLTDRTRALEFSSRRPYAECLFEVLRLAPHLRLGVAPYVADKEFSGIEFIEEDSDEDAA